jgi:hypothetical protein
MVFKFSIFLALLHFIAGQVLAADLFFDLPVGFDNAKAYTL